MKIFWKSLACAIIAAFSLTACYNGPSSDEIYNESDVVLTNYNKEYNFGAQKYFAIRDRIYTVQVGSNGKIERDSLSDKDSQTLTSAVVTNMQAQGYQQVVKNTNGDFGYTDADGNFLLQKPDLGLNTIVLSNVTQVNTIIWGGWYDPYYWGWWGYPYYPPYYPGYVSSFSYTVGALVIDMFDYNDTPPSEANPVKGQWTGVIRGIDSGSKSTNLQKGISGINQMFIQSPYIQSK